MADKRWIKLIIYLFKKMVSNEITEEEKKSLVKSKY